MQVWVFIFSDNVVANTYSDSVGPFRYSDTVLKTHSSYLVNQHRSVFHQLLANPVQTLNILLF